MSAFLAIAIPAVTYVILTVGITMIFGDSLKKALLEFRMRKRLRERRRGMREPDSLTKHLDLMLKTVFKRNVPVGLFKAVTLLVFGSVYFAALQVLDPGAAVISGIIVALFPYLIIRIRLENIRKKSSFEGEAFIGEFLAQYRICRYNVFETMAKMAEEKNKAETCVGLIRRILFLTRNSIQESAVKEATGSFSYAINTNWARMFAYNLKTAIITGENVSLAVEDVFLQLREARTLGEERIRMNAEATRIVIFLIPVMYIATVLISVKYVGLSWTEYFHNQFGTPEGFMLLLVIIVMFLINIIIIEVVNNQRFDF